MSQPTQIKNAKINFAHRFMQRWDINSHRQLIIILIVFSITGSAAVILANPITHLLGLEQGVTSPWIFWPIRILLIFPIYQFMLIIIGSLFGQFRFFWAFEKKMLDRFRRKS